MMQLLMLIFDREFLDFIQIGWDHIIDPRAYDHLLFIMVLCAVFTYNEWKKILVLVTAFTIGHSLTLALSSLDVLLLPSRITDILIPVTILATALANVVRKENSSGGKTFDNRINVNYGIALGFGLIHGLGFANNFKFISGENSSILKQLFAFNSGLELGQITVVVFFMSLVWLLSRCFNMVHREWMLFISGAGAGVSLILIISTILE